MPLTIKRRELLLGLAGGAAAVHIFNSLPELSPLSHIARADLVEKERHVLLVVFLRGGFDGLSLMCPTQGEDRRQYESARPHLALPLEGSEAVLPLDGQFALHAAARPLHGLFKEGRLAFVHACGLAIPSRSHFVAQTLMELGVGRTGEDSRGWLTRFMQQVPCKAAVIGPLTPTSLQGASNTMAYTRLKGLGLEGSAGQQAQVRSVLRELYSRAGESARYGITALNMLDEFEDQQHAAGGKESGDLPSGEIAQKFAIAGRLLQSDKRLQVMTLDIGGWDTHRAQGNLGEGYFAKQLASLSRAVNEFYRTGLVSSNAWVTTVFVSEFGRRLKENSNRGTDHGHGNTMMVLGPRIRGGRTYGRWPGLVNESLFERSDLAVTTDARLVLYRCLQTIAPSLSLESVFSGLNAGGLADLELLI